jgi:hypothetical protein
MIDEQAMLECDSCGIAQGEDKDNEVEEVEPGLVLCAECEQDHYTYCCVCKSYLHRDSARNHRHLFMTDDCAWYGTGGIDMGESEYEEVRLSLHALLDWMGKRFARDLARTVKNNHMCYDNLHTVTGIVLGPTLVFCYLDGGWMRKEKRYATHSYGDKLYKIFSEYEPKEDEEVEPFSYGFWWLFSLDGEKTEEDNNRTLGWIAEWQAGRSKR